MLVGGCDFSVAYIPDGAAWDVARKDNEPLKEKDDLQRLLFQLEDKMQQVSSKYATIAAMIDNALFITGKHVPGIIKYYPKPLVSDVVVQHVSLGLLHIVFTDSDGVLWGAGSNRCGQLGVADVTEVSSPAPVDIGEKIERAVCGEYFTMALDEVGHLWSFGKNINGELGIGVKSTGTHVPQFLPQLADIIDLDCGEEHTTCVDIKGHVYSWGKGTNGRLGDTEQRLTPAVVEGIQDIVTTRCGNGFTLCLDSSGRVWAFGTNYCGQLGLGHNQNVLNPTRIESLRDVARIVCGGMHAFCIDMNGCIWGFGCNEKDQLGLGDTENRNKPSPLPEYFCLRLLKKKCMAKSARK